jgi:predicted LPLAT superfamily acyltransferase
MSGPHWSDRPEGGGHFALWLIVTIALHGGRVVARLLLYPITVYFYLRRGPERRASRAFLSHVLERPVGALAVMRHIHRFASVILDRVYLLSDHRRHFDLRVHGLAQMMEYYERGEGMLLLGAHVGSFEVLRVLSLERPDIRVRAVLDKSQTPAMTELLHALNPTIRDSVIDASSGSTSVVLALKEAAEAGDVLALLGDRARPGEPTRQVTFLGRPARMPVAPYLLASVLQVPVVLCFGLYRGGNRYDLYFEQFSQRIDIPRNQRDAQLHEWLDRYARRLEHYARLDPYNWFNFYDFWHCDETAAAAPARHPAAEPRRA